ncbi:MAG: ABC transporter permease [Rhizobiaceae bacterium]|nr:MAG: ABC transporter permease [Rhizobiaceae bacterium]CAG1006387.1 Autoinducer 2 import system permease protein LsrD [Rhizobiaceae bacterium]
MTALRHLLRKPWIGAYAGALAIWLATVAFTEGQGGGGVLTAALSFATFSVLVAIGQMYVITLGPGNVDLSIPATMTLAGAVSMKVMDGNNAMIVPGLAIALGCGAGVGVFNYGLIRLLRIPPIIATLSSSFLFLSAAISYSRGLRIKPPPLLADFTTWIVWGVPVLAVAGMVLTFVMSVILHRTIFGRTVTAIGQNARAARLAGLPVDRVRFATYVMCGMFAGLTGYLVSGFSGGAALNMGAEYLLASIAVVVIGGTSVAGGFANLPGLWGAAMLLFLLVTMLNTYGFGAGIRMVLTGVIIIAVIAVASGRRPSG